MQADDFAKCLIHRLEHPETAPAIIVRPMKPQPIDAPLIDGQPDVALEIATPDGGVLMHVWRSMWDAI